MVVPVHHSEKKKRKKLKKKKTKKNRRKTEHANPQYSEDMLKMEDKLRKNLLKTPVVEQVLQVATRKIKILFFLILFFLFQIKLFLSTNINLWQRRCLF